MLPGFCLCLVFITACVVSANVQGLTAGTIDEKHGAWHVSSCEQKLQIPKVALLFLSHHEIHQLELWRTWLKQAVRVVPTASLLPLAKHELDAVVSACKSLKYTHNHPHQQQLLFSVFLHNAPDAKAAEYGTEHQLQDRLATQWGSITLVEAERRLLQAALRDPLNRFFALVSDTSIPLYPPLVVYQQLLAREVSAINACPLYHNPFASQGMYDSWHRMDWYGLNDESILPRDKWRKSEQWFGLMRPHAELVADENNTLWKYMLQQCPLSNVDGNGEEKKCILDEHYPATALAIAGKEWESDCYGHLHFTEWRDGEVHPVSWEGEELTMEALVNMRAGWHSDTQHCESLKTAPPRIDTLAFVWLDEVADGQALTAMLRDSGRREAVGKVTRLHPYCPMFARKFPWFVAGELMDLLSQAPMRVVSTNVSMAVKLYNEIAA